MLKWDAEAVGRFLSGRPVFEDNSSDTFSFLILGQEAQLRVFAYTNEIEIRIGNPPQAVWRLVCSEITYGDELPEEGGDCLVFKPMHCEETVSHWIVLGRCDSGYEIVTVFRGVAD